MIELRRAFVVACGFTVLVLALFTACDVSSPAPQPTPVASETAAALAPTATSPVASEAPTPTLEPTPSTPQGGVLTMRLGGDVPDLKPWDLRSRGEEHIADLLYNGLIELDAQLQPQPDLAQDWVASADGRLITFTLRSNLTWHDATPLTAEDVAWTLNTLRTITATNALLSDLQATIADVSVPLPETVVVSLTRPHAPLLAELAVPILPRHRLADRTPEQIAALNFWDEPIGSGPFKLDERQPAQSISFSRNNTYFGGTPNLDQVVLIVAPDPAVAMNALQEQQLLVAEFPNATELLSPTIATDGLQRGAYPENGWYGLAFNTRSDRLFADQRVREALARAVDVEDLVQSVTNGAGQPIATIISRSSSTYPTDLEILPADVDAARRLLDEAGWAPGPDGVRQKDGRPLATRIWVRGDDPRRVAAAGRIAEAAQAIGMQLEVVPANFNTVILPKLAPPYDFDLLLGSWINAPNSMSFPTNRFYDPDDFALFHSSNVWGGQGDARGGLRNVTGFANPDYDAAAEESRRAYEPTERQESIQTAQSVLAREMPYLLLWTDEIAVVMDQRVSSEDAPISLDTPRYLWNVEQWYLQP